MTKSRISAVVFAQIVTLSLFAAVGCSQDDHGADAANLDPAAAQAATEADPTAFTKDDQLELNDVGVTDDEAIVDEGAPIVTTEGEGDDASEVDVPPAPGEPEPEANPIADDADDDAALEPAFADDDAAPAAASEDAGDDGDADADPDLETQSFHSGIAVQTLRPLAGNTKTVATGKTYKCRKATPGRRCVCKSSPVNCQLPNVQHGFRNRYVPPAVSDQIGAADGHADAQKKIEKELGRWMTTPPAGLFDGAGQRRADDVAGDCFEYTTGLAGTTKVAGACVRINFGQMKTMDADGAGGKATYVYGWSVSVTGAAASSWIPLAAFADSAAVKKMGVARNPKIGKTAPVQYVLKSGQDWSHKATFTIADLPKWAQDGAIAKDKVGKSGARARDYLLRNDLAQNLAYSTPGVGGASTDTLIVRPESPVRFKRVRSTIDKPTLVRVPVYGAGSRHYFTWAYGEINGRWGWIPLAALKIASGDSCSGKQDGFYCSEQSPFSGFACEGQTVAYGHQCASDKQKCAGLNADKTDIVCK